MTEITLIRRTGDYLVPATEHDREVMSHIKIGEGMRCKFTKQRNIWFHRKYFALLNLAYEHWEPEAEKTLYKGHSVEKNFGKFRNDITILSGFYTSAFNLKGEIQLVAKSISFGSMGEDEFCDLYDKTIDVILQKVLRNYTKDDLNSVVDEVMGFV